MFFYDANIFIICFARATFRCDDKHFSSVCITFGFGGNANSSLRFFFLLLLLFRCCCPSPFSPNIFRYLWLLAYTMNDLPLTPSSSLAFYFLTARPVFFAVVDTMRLSVYVFVCHIPNVVHAKSQKHQERRTSVPSICISIFAFSFYFRFNFILNWVGKLEWWAGRWSEIGAF